MARKKPGTVAETRNPSTLLEAKRRAQTPAKPAANSGQANVLPHRWKPGQSGNPYGRPRSSTEMKQKFTELTDVATEIIAMKVQLQHMRLQKVLDTVADPNSSLEDFELACSIIEGTSMDAVTTILDRGHGKALQKVEVDDKRDFDDLTPEEFDDMLIRVGAKVMTGLKARREARITDGEGQQQPAGTKPARARRNGTKVAPGGG